MRHVRERADVGLALRASASVSSRVACWPERVQPRIVGPGRHALGVDLVDLVDRTVDVEVEARVEHVLVVRRGDAFAR